MAPALRIMSDVFASPASAFAALKERPRCILAGTIISLCSVALAVLLIPFSIQIVERTVGDSGNQQSLHKVLEATRSLSILGALATPAALSLKWLLFSGILFSLSVLFDIREARFKAIFAIVVHAELILLIMGLLNLAMLSLRGLDSIHALQDLCAIPGLLTFVHPQSLSQPVLIVLANINVFTLWYLALVGVGYSVATGFRKWKSLFLVLIIWLVGVGFQAAVSHLFNMMR